MHSYIDLCQRFVIFKHRGCWGSSLVLFVAFCSPTIRKPFVPVVGNIFELIADMNNEEAPYFRLASQSRQDFGKTWYSFLGPVVSFFKSLISHIEYLSRISDHSYQLFGSNLFTRCTWSQIQVVFKTIGVYLSSKCSGCAFYCLILGTPDHGSKFWLCSWKKSSRIGWCLLEATSVRRGV